MSAGEEFIIGAEVACDDGTCGELRRVVVDPIARAITHLVVEPRHRPDGGRLVPIDRVEIEADRIRIRCTMSEFESFEDAEESKFLPGASGQWGYGQSQMFSLPYFGLGGLGQGGIGMRIGGLGLRGLASGDTRGMDLGADPRPVMVDKVPVGEVEVRRGQQVYATDGPIGSVHGLVVDPSDHQVTHVLLAEGHLWGKKDVAIPIGAVIGVDAGVRLNLTKDEVRDLPPVEIDHHV